MAAIDITPAVKEKMQCIADMVRLMNPDGIELQRIMDKGDAEAFVMKAAEWVLKQGQEVRIDSASGRYEAIETSALEQEKKLFAGNLAATVNFLQQRVEDRFGRYIGNDPKVEPTHDENHAKGDVRRVARGLEMIDEASGARREWLVETVASIFDYARKNPFFDNVLNGADKTAAAVRGRLSEIGRSAGEEPGRPPNGASGAVFAPEVR